MYKNPFFTDIPDVGDLDWEEIIVDDACPIFFTLISTKGQRYISVCCELYEEQRWVIAPISNTDLIRLLTNKLSMKNAFFTQSNEKCFIAHWSKGNPKLRYDVTVPNELPDQDLPLDEMLDAEEGEFAEYIKKIQDSEFGLVADILVSEISDGIININLSTSVLSNTINNVEIFKEYISFPIDISGRRHAYKRKKIKHRKTFEFAYDL